MIDSFGHRSLFEGNSKKTEGGSFLPGLECLRGTGKRNSTLSSKTLIRSKVRACSSIPLWREVMASRVTNFWDWNFSEASLGLEVIYSKTTLMSHTGTFLCLTSWDWAIPLSRREVFSHLPTERPSILEWKAEMAEQCSLIRPKRTSGNGVKRKDNRGLCLEDSE